MFNKALLISLYRSKSYKVIALAFMLLVSGYAQAKNSFLVAPGRVDFDLSKPTTQSFIITNNGEGKIRLTITPTYIPISDKSLAAGEHLNSETAKLEDITKSIRVAPKTLSLKPGQRRDIRISIRPPKNITPGDYRTHLLVAMKEVSHTIKKEAEGDNSVGMQLNIKMETAVAIYGRMGERSPEISIACTNSGKQHIQVLNESPWRFDGIIEFYSGNSTTPAYEDRVVSLRESKNTLLIKDKLSGNYKVRWIDFESREEVGRSTCSF